MPINPVEDLNTFSEALQDELSKRSRSKELVRTRAPFLRFTTGAKMSDLNKNFPYSGCEFFSLGLHGWDNLEYSAADVYGSKAMNGLLVGVTYKQNEKPKFHSTRSLVFLSFWHSLPLFPIFPSFLLSFFF